MITVDNIHNYIDFNKTNIVLGKGYAIQELVFLLQEAQKTNKIENEFDFLPSPVVHHENYDTHFKGHLWEHKNPIIFVQNKEFLEAVLQSVDSGFNIVSTNFNLIQVDLKPIRDKEGQLTFIDNPAGGKDVKTEIVIKTYEKKEAKRLFIDEHIDLRDVSFGGYGEL